MEKQSRKYEKQFIIVELFLLLILTFILYITNNNKIEKINNYNQTNRDIIYLKSEITNKSYEIEQLNKKIESYNDLDGQLISLKQEYYNTIKELEDKILKGESNKKIAYLTFDDGPYYNTYKVLDILDRYGVKATFFTTSINGEYCFDNKSQNCYILYQEYLKRGHTIANHTYTHGIWKGLYSSTDSFINAVKSQEDHVKNLSSGYTTNILRFPGGSASAGSNKYAIIERLRQMGYGWVDWTAGDGDGGKLYSTEQAWNNFTSSINQNIEVVLLHDYNGITTAILPDIIEYLQNNGYILLPLFYESNVINK